jgi:subtilisin family serine protease
MAGENRSILRRSGLAGLRAATTGHAGIRIALIDGPIALHESLRSARIHRLGAGAPVDAATAVTRHGTFIASMLAGTGDDVLGICPGCTLLSVPSVDERMISGSATARETATALAAAMNLAVDANADVVQIGLSFAANYERAFEPLAAAIRRAAARGVRTILPAGNESSLAPSALLSLPGVIPVGIATASGELDPHSTWGPAIAQRGLCAIGVDIPGALSPSGYTRRSGSSFAATIVTGAFALLYAAKGNRSAAWNALLEPVWRRARSSMTVPGLLDAGHFGSMKGAFP